MKQSRMRRWFIILGALVLGIVLFFQVNQRYKILDMSSMSVSASPGLLIDSVQIRRGFYSINRSNDTELFDGTSNDRLVFDGHQVGALDTDYGENDFLITYGGKYYFQFRHFLTNSNYQHDYEFRLEQHADSIIVSAIIEGPEAMSFSRPMSLIASAGQLRCNVSTDSSKVIYNMLELE